MLLSFAEGWFISSLLKARFAFSTSGSQLPDISARNARITGQRKQKLAAQLTVEEALISQSHNQPPDKEEEPKADDKARKTRTSHVLLPNLSARRSGTWKQRLAAQLTVEEVLLSESHNQPPDKEEEVMADDKALKVLAFDSLLPNLSARRSGPWKQKLAAQLTVEEALISQSHNQPPDKEEEPKADDKARKTRTSHVLLPNLSARRSGTWKQRLAAQLTVEEVLLSESHNQPPDKEEEVMADDKALKVLAFDSLLPNLSARRSGPWKQKLAAQLTVEEALISQSHNQPPDKEEEPKADDKARKTRTSHVLLPNLSARRSGTWKQRLAAQLTVEEVLLSESHNQPPDKEEEVMADDKALKVLAFDSLLPNLSARRSGSPGTWKQRLAAQLTVEEGLTSESHN